MRKFYFFISALVCIMGGVNSANAQGDSEVTDIPLELNAASAVMKLVKYNGGDNQLSRKPSQVPEESRVLWAFSGDKFLSRTGMVWGTDNGNYPEQIDLREGTSNGFVFKGRKGYNGEFVAQMYTLADEVKTMDISFTFVSTEAELAFSVWQVSSSTATLLDEKATEWVSGETYTFEVARFDGNPISRYGDRIVLLWSCATGGVDVNISEFSATAHCTPNSASDVTFKVHKEGSAETSFEHTMRLPVNQALTTADLLPSLGWISFEEKEFTITDASNENEISVSYTYNKNAEYPCAISYEDLTAENLWVSFITQMNRMHVYDANSVGNNYVYNSATETYENKGTVKKYPTIDRATFANLSDRKFWGLVCENPLENSCVKIYNKGEGNKNTLYLTQSGDNSPLLFKEEDGDVPSSWITDEWIVEKGNKEEDIQYFCLKAKGTTHIINNNANAGYMTTWNASPTTGGNAKGSNIRFVGELETYKIMRDRALAAPSNAINSLTAEARGKMIGSTVLEYKEEIAAIQDLRDGGVIPFVEGGYYYLRNYTPDGGSTYVLTSENGTNATTALVATDLANSDDMPYSNINAIWKITTDPNSPAVDINSEDIGVSKTIGRFVTHVNSDKRLNGVGQRQLTADGATYYFVNLGAGQHFLKNVQYKGSGEQAKAASLSCDDNGSLGTHSIQNNNQNKNTRSTWYGIPVNSIDVTITDAGYATIYLPFGVTLPEDNTLTAYAVTAAADGVATLTAVENIPANKGVILKGTKGQKYTLKIDDNVSWEGITNLLEGSCMAENVSEDAYVLAMPAEKEVGLYMAEKNQDNNVWLNNANKAYLPANVVTAGDARFLSFNFDTVTGLDVIKGTESTSAEASAVYDLSGRRVRTAQKGLYIMNGKKVIK